MGISNYFKGGRIARMSDGSYCVVRDLGLVKGGKGLRCFECLLRFGVLSKLVQILWDSPERPKDGRFSEASFVGVSRPLESK
jgi:hypothetical protein